jgi:hypothetical protein
MVCCNPSLGLATKARACKVIGFKRKPENEGKCEEMNPRTPKGASTLGIGVRWIPESSKNDRKGQNPFH